jgi:hypothetical protein
VAQVQDKVALALVDSGYFEIEPFNFFCNKFVACLNTKRGLKFFTKIDEFGANCISIGEEAVELLTIEEEERSIRSGGDSKYSRVSTAIRMSRIETSEFAIERRRHPKRLSGVRWRPKSPSS